MIRAHAGLGDGFKRCCRNGGIFDGIAREFYFPRMNFHTFGAHHQWRPKAWQERRAGLRISGYDSGMSVGRLTALEGVSTREWDINGTCYDQMAT
jgi:hypothetical protein